MNLYFLAIMVLAYLMGNISPSTIIGNIYGIDIRKSGSGNPGTTNALRTLGKKAAIITLIVDVGKGFLAVKIALLFLPYNLAIYSALMVFLGHVYPVFMKFKGGKGVATAFGALLAINWMLAVGCLLVVAVVVSLTSVVSLGSILAALSFVPLSYFLEPQFLKVGIIMAIVLIYKHRENIKRLIRGEENKISFKKGR